MILVVLLIGIILVVVAIRNTQGALFSALAADVPAYIVWAAAIIALGAIGWIPGLKPVSRGLLALVLVVIVLQNYQAILAGFQAVASPPSSGSSASAVQSVGDAPYLEVFHSLPSVGSTVSSPTNSFSSGAGVQP